MFLLHKQNPNLTHSGNQQNTPGPAGELLIFSSSIFRRIKLRHDEIKDSRDGTQTCWRDDLFLDRRRRDLEGG